MHAPSDGPPKAIKTPCTKVCTVDGASGLCLGCLRSLQEIAEWSRLDEATRETILDELPGRVSRLDPALQGLVPR
jgi:predicted Fe-S protein YdhL (DUF1289 family)